MASAIGKVVLRQFIASADAALGKIKIGEDNLRVPGDYQIDGYHIKIDAQSAGEGYYVIGPGKEILETIPEEKERGDFEKVAFVGRVTGNNTTVALHLGVPNDLVEDTRNIFSKMDMQKIERLSGQPLSNDNRYMEEVLNDRTGFIIFAEDGLQQMAKRLAGSGKSKFDNKKDSK